MSIPELEATRARLMARAWLHQVAYGLHRGVLMDHLLECAADAWLWAAERAPKEAN